MPTIETDPVDYAEIDSSGTHSTGLPLSQSINGFQAGEFYEANDANALHRNAALWKRWLDQTRANTAQLGFSTSFRTSAAIFNYGVGPGLVDRLVQADSFYVVLGLYVSLTLARLVQFQTTIWKHTFTASKTHHFYVDAAGNIIVSVVNLGTPAAPGVGFETLLSVDTDATDITAETVGPKFLSQHVENTQPLVLTGILTVSAPAKFDGGNVTIDKLDAQNRRIDLTVDGLTTKGWRILHNTAERLIIQELIGGVATDILDFGVTGSPGTPITTPRPVLINSDQNSLGNPALKIQTNFVGAPGAYFLTAGAPALTAEVPAYAATMVLVPTISTAFIASHPRGSLRVRNDANSELEYKDNNDVARKVWASDGGMRPDDAYTLANVNNFAGAQVAQSFNYTFIAGQRYLIKMACRVGRAAGSTRDALFTCTVGGVALAYSGQTLTLFQGGGAGELEQKFEDEVLFTAGAGGALAVQLLVTPVNGAGNLNIAARSCRVLGHFQP